MTTRGSLSLEVYPVTSCFGYGTVSDEQSHQWDTVGKEKKNGVITLPYSINMKKTFACSSTLIVIMWLHFQINQRTPTHGKDYYQEKGKQDYTQGYRQETAARSRG